jgi:uncharacterized protein YcfL
MKIFAKFVFTFSLVGLIAGCNTAQHKPGVEPKLEQLGKMEYVRVDGIKQVVRDGLMQLQAELYNEDHRNQKVFWRVRWLDADGLQVWDDEQWKQELIYGNQRRILQITAPTRKATDFRIELQSPKNEAF